MRAGIGRLGLTASDLVGFLNCRHLTELDRAVTTGKLAKPKVWSPALEVLRERGLRHEEDYVTHLTDGGLSTLRIEGIEITPDAVGHTLDAMRGGIDVIVQGALSHGRWSGRVDVLKRVEAASAFGTWSYEVTDTKLARETKAGTVLQLCVYSDLLAEAQGTVPERMHVVAPWSDYRPQTFRLADFAAFYRRAKLALEESIDGPAKDTTYPDPKPHCDVCRWNEVCEKRRRDDDHLSLVANASKLQIAELTTRGTSTVAALAEVPLPITWKPEHGTASSFERLREQARVQVRARESGQPYFELLPIEKGLGLGRLPEPSEGDIFLDLEGDRFVGEHGLEYLFGCWMREHDEWTYREFWATTRAEEKAAFEALIDLITARWKAGPGLHVYHYAPYEPAALKRLMGRYLTREDELDRMLRARLFVDLYAVVRQGIRAGVESYSIKKLEPYYGYVRQTPLKEANHALLALQTQLELEAVPVIDEEDRVTVQRYNEDDCRSAEALRAWLERLRTDHIATGVEIPRPVFGPDGTPNANVAEWLARVAAVFDRLIANVPVDPVKRTPEQQARWLLANLLDWHRREMKATWWEYFRLDDLSADDLRDEKRGLADLQFVGTFGGTAKCPIHRYQFSDQDFDIRSDDELRSVTNEDLGTVFALSAEERTIDIKKKAAAAGAHPTALFAHKIIRADVLAEALLRLGEDVASRGMSADGSYQAARDLLLRRPPRVNGEPLRNQGETPLEAALRLVPFFYSGVLPIQGPPGSGKTYTAARMICELVRAGKKVGVTANSHKVIRNVLDETIKAADSLGIAVPCWQKVTEVEEPSDRIQITASNDDPTTFIQQNAGVVGGTAWFWARPEAFELVDVLFVDEAAQMALANVLAVSQAAKTVVLVGDPQQLDQPVQGPHPDGCAVSSLHHILGDQQTIGPEQGLFLNETWRLHPDICAFTSELFYEGKLRSKDALVNQVLKGTERFAGSGLRYIAAPHSGNQSSSTEEASVVHDVVHSLLRPGATWIDGSGTEKPLELKDILIITPYNAQVAEIRRRLPDARVGTVDKFQGQEAAVAIYSMATSSHADAPRGMEFLYSLNRFNVATSRARCLSILVSSPLVLEAECRTPRQMQLANAFCRYLELAVPANSQGDSVWIVRKK
jgi:uncharacterized protein